MRLTRAEEQVMQILWILGEGLVKDILCEFPQPRPARNTVSTIVRILEKKGFIDHKSYGRFHVYYPVVSRQEYSKNQLFGLLESYFNNSFPVMASCFASEKALSLGDLEQILEDTKKELSRSRNKKK